jgi:hypothetical protein
MQEVTEICELLLLQGVFDREALLREISIFFNAASVRAPAGA